MADQLGLFPPSDLAAPVLLVPCCHKCGARGAGIPVVDSDDLAGVMGEPWTWRAGAAWAVIELAAHEHDCPGPRSLTEGCDT